MRRKGNRLSTATSPYLLQHADDPVDWYPFGDEAFERARQLDRPVFLSIGYSSCHWCHVMAHESFHDPETAREMNEAVVAVKVDREERPDVDSIYMEAVQAATGSGGWPMSIFATPEGKPFFAGTYFPDRPRHGTPSFRQVLAAVKDVWTNRREDVTGQADALSSAVERRQRGALSLPQVGSTVPGRAADQARRAIGDAAARLTEMADPVHGGFGRAPKFPQPLYLDLLLRAHVSGIADDLETAPIDVVQLALESMSSGGIWDHLGGGFARYSVDREWLVPHFEKMLYDQALLGRVLLHAWQCTGDMRWRQVLGELVDYVLRDLRLYGAADGTLDDALSGALASGEDADSEGEEGRFYVWTRDEVEKALGAGLGHRAAEWWGVTKSGNFEGRSILHRPVRGDLVRPEEIEEARRKLFALRSSRTRPGRDDKVLSEWNAMMCSTLAEAALVTGQPGWGAAAVRIANVLDEKLRRPSDGRVLRAAPRGGGAEPSQILGYAVDAAWMVDAFTRTAQLTGEASFVAKAEEVADQLLELFVDPETGGLFTTGHDAPALVVRPRETTDGVTPSATSVAAVALARLSALSGRSDLFEQSERLVASCREVLERAPVAVPELLWAAELTAFGTVDVGITGARPDLVEAVAARFEPRVVVAWEKPGGAGGRLPLFEGRPTGAAYVCRFGECRLPARSVKELTAELDAALASA